MVHVEYRVLGTLDVAVNGRSLSLKSLRQRIVMAMLLLSANKVVPLSRLIDAIWDERPPETARSQVQICISVLRKHFRSAGAGDVIQTRPEGYLLAIGDDQLDLETFELLVARARAARADGQTSEATGFYRSALAAWRENAVIDLDSPVVRSIAARLDEERLTVLEERIECDLELGRHLEVVGELTQLVLQHPLRERLRAHHMLALYRSGRQAEALESYQSMRRILRDEMGLEPGRPLKRLEQLILTEHDSIAPPATSYESRPAGPNVPRQLPAMISDFSGHSRHFSEIVEFMSAHEEGVQVASISGSGGAGKTTLAVRVAHQLADRFPDGQLFAQLRTGDGQQVPTMWLLERFLRVLGGPEFAVPGSFAERSVAYRSVLAERKVLLVLDDADGVDQIRPLIPGSAGCAVIATSRRSLLGLDGCREWELGPMDEESSMTLLANVVGSDRVRAEREAAIEVLRLCSRLPLALRIVAAKLATRPHWTIGKMARRLADEQRRLDEIAIGNSSIRSCISISYRNLSKECRTLLLRLGLLGMREFPAWVGAPLLDLPVQAAEEILEELVEERLVDIVLEGSDRPRFRVHDLIRLYAAERAAIDEDSVDSMQAVERMLDAWLGLAGEAHRRAYGGDFVVLHGDAARWELPADLTDELMADPIGWLHSERDNLVAAVFHAQRARLDEVCWDLAVTLVTLFESENLVDDWRATHRAALEVVRERGNQRGEAAVLCSLGTLEALERSAEASDYLKTALDIFGNIGEKHGEALALQGEGFNARLAGDRERALHYSTLALAAFRGVDDSVGEIDALNNIARLLLERLETERAQEFLREAHTKATKLGVGRITAQTEYRMGEALLRAGGLELAAELFRSVIGLCQESHDLLGEAYGLYGLGSLAIAQRDQYSAETYLSDSLKLADRLENELLRDRILNALHSLRPTD